MATVNGLTAERMLEIEAASVVDGEIKPDGHLILTTHGGTEIDAGSITVTQPMLAQMLYPVGSIYMAINAANPGLVFGGTWVAWGTGRVPVGVDTSDTDFNTVEKTGGEKKHLLTAAESGLPGHNHTQNAHNHTQNSHNHTQDAHAHSINAHGHFFHPSTNFHSYRWGGGEGVTVYLAGVNMTAGTPPGNELSAPQGTSNQTQGSAQTLTAASGAATNQATTATNIAATATNIASTPVDATVSHNNQQQYITCYMWKRTA